MMTVDSAASGTAYHSGVKTKYETVGVDDTVVRRNCSSVEGAKVTSILDWALQSGTQEGKLTNIEYKKVQGQFKLHCSPNF